MLAYRGTGKRILDLLVAVPLCVVTLPLQAVIAVIVRVRLGSPVLFRQVRPGLGGRPFTMLKFRTMNDRRGPDGELLADEERLPVLGEVLRSTSLDELPELYNVVKGDMSLVGPRPLLMAYLERYSTRQARRHEVRPGMTGLAQVSGRNRLDWESRFELDVQYVDSFSLTMDLRIIWVTVTRVLKRADTSAEGHATAPEFLGSTVPGD